MKTLNTSSFSRPPLSTLSLLFPAQDFCQLSTAELGASLLTNMQASIPRKPNLRVHSKHFICQDSMPEDDRYYEQIIFEDDTIPTRQGSWHDFFNGLIWLQFPQTKSYLNRLHIGEINSHGLSPRSKVRNHITHFDECGVVLFVKAGPLLAKLHGLFEAQAWTALFCELKAEWNTRIFPVVFGHANLEMLLKPFIGLTGKVLLVQIDDTLLIQGPILENNQVGAKPPSQSLFERGVVDTLLLEHVQKNQTFFAAKPFYPLPLLGVPDWHYAQQDTAFYANTNYFMPKRQRNAGVDG